MVYEFMMQYYALNMLTLPLAFRTLAVDSSQEFR